MCRSNYLHRVCHHAIYLDRNFNAAQFLQSIDRIHRLGLEDSVETNVEILRSPGTIDDIVNQRLNSKVSNMQKCWMIIQFSQKLKKLI